MKPLLVGAPGYGTVSPVREWREFWVCLTESLMMTHQQDSHGFVIKAPWPWPFEDQRSKSFDRPVPVSTRGQASCNPARGCSYNRPAFPLCFHSSTNTTPSTSLCASGDLWSRSLLQHSAPAHHLPRWLQLETGTVASIIVSWVL